MSKATAWGPGAQVPSVAITPQGQLCHQCQCHSASNMVFQHKKSWRTSTYHMPRKHIFVLVKLSHRPSCMSRDTVSGSRNVLLSSAEESLHTEYPCPPVEGQLEDIHERMTMMVKGLVHRTYKKRLSTGFVQIWEGKAWLVVI